MGLIFYVREATGRAKCKLCKEFIAPDQKAIVVEGYRTNGQIHNNPKYCKEERR